MDYQPRERATTSHVQAWHILTAALLLLVIVGIFSAVVRFSTELTANSDETALNREYATCWLKLGNYYTDAENALHLASANTKALTTIISAVALGNNAKYTALPINNPSNQIYVDIQRAYPDLHTAADAYNLAGAVMLGDFQNYSAETQVLLAKIENFDNLRYGATGMFISDYPNHILRADTGHGIAYGLDAETQMSTIITNAKVAQSYSAGHTQSIQFP
jgi:hypothetical protein